jgi:hypothetical protein
LPAASVCPGREFAQPHGSAHKVQQKNQFEENFAEPQVEMLATHAV